MILHDKDIREPLFDFLEETYGKIRIIEEKTMGKSRADVVMVTEEDLVGIEIKSDADTYTRLSRQVRDYDRFFDRNIVVVGSSHGLHIKEHVPEHWGIITVELVDGAMDFYIMRQPSENKKLKPANKMKILWKSELFELQQKYGMPKYRNKSKKFVVEKMLERFPDEESKKQLSADISAVLFERDYSVNYEGL